jgi:hypothetical protein
MESWVGKAEPPLSLDLPIGEDGDVTLGDFILDNEISSPDESAGPPTGSHLEIDGFSIRQMKPLPRLST